MGYIKFADFTDGLKLEVIYEGGINSLEYRTSDINRPGLQLSGYFDHFSDTALRLQVIGKIEMYYIETLEPEICEKRLDTYFSYPIQCVVVTGNMDIPEVLINKAQKYHRSILRSSRDTTSFIHSAVDYLDSKLAPSITMHAELIDVYGIGILLTGESGIGKSEITLELISKGHHLVADDVVDVKRVSENRLVGESPEITKYFIEVRGIGIIDIRTMYGVGAFVNSKPIDILIHLENWDDQKSYDRLGNDTEYTDILGVKVPKLTIPVRPGRNIAIIVEVAARNFRLKGMGYQYSSEFYRLVNGEL